MLKQKTNLTQTTSFNSGQVRMLVVQNGTIISNGMNIDYGEKTIGVYRQSLARQANLEIKRLVAVPYGCWLEEADTVELKDYETGQRKIYHVADRQPKADGAPPHILLSLTEAGVIYDDQRPDPNDF